MAWQKATDGRAGMNSGPRMQEWGGCKSVFSLAELLIQNREFEDSRVCRVLTKTARKIRNNNNGRILQGPPDGESL
jgi:hypothetical protein